METNENIQHDKKTKVEHGSIYEALAAVTREISPIGKDRKNEQQGFKYRGIEDFINEIHTLYARHGIIVFSDVLDVMETERVTKNGGTMLYPRASVRFTFFHEGGTCHTSTITGSAMDSADKGLNKCYSIAYKYAITFLHNVPTSILSDPDGTTPEASKPVQQGGGNRTPQGGGGSTTKKTIEDRGSESYNNALSWLRKDPANNTLSKLQQNYVVSAKILSELAVDAGVPTGGTRPSDSKSTKTSEK